MRNGSTWVFVVGFLLGLLVFTALHWHERFNCYTWDLPLMRCTSAVRTLVLGE